MHRLLQLTLDLFDPSPAPEPVAVPPPPPPQVAAPPAEPLDQVLEPVRFLHPRANRQAVLEGVRVAYELRRARRRHIGFTVGAEGLVVSAPKWVPLYEIEAALQKKAAWIVRKLGELRDRSQRSEAARIEWKDGATVSFLGEPVIVVLDPRHAFDGVGAVLRTDEQTLPGLVRRTLHVGLPQHASADQVRDAVQAWLMRQATRIFTLRLDHYAARLGVRWSKLSLSNAGTRWGTARSDGSIRLHWRLVQFRLAVIDYVVAHELSHLRVMDHSPRFWDTVGTLVPEYAQLRAELKSEPLPPW
ncbi:M48 family metallopeptidase [Ramlibacter rhizophilus]|uniref:M48 family peptidase n=1 Tax=Ramlibacter rhizophilus TaxID=1781167 RepID=A0A4Z0BJK7_9BURK|nr:SprT family zinc-dependent metalloprotease [Ramlibacter rhizophilus]TFY99476.1 M48 family peptidase [Ramlibacter rhizophilus]